MKNTKPVANRQWPAYNTIWRWHFYAGLFCIPFILVLSVSGAIYLFKPQVEAALNAPYTHLALTGKPQTAAAQVQAALAAVPGSRLNAYELPESADSAVQVLVGHDRDLTRVYLHPVTLQILKQEHEDARLMQIVHQLHGNLLIGDRGSNIVELAASWAIVMMITGLFLWWPRNTNSLAGIAYPRLGRNGRLFWRDLHAVTGFWISLFTLFLLLSGLPWAKSWGGLLKDVRSFSEAKLVQQDWTTGRSSELAERSQRNTSVPDNSEHANHAGHMHGVGGHFARVDYSAIDRMVTTVQPLHLVAPVLIAPPSRRSPEWTARSDAQNRPLRVNLVLDANTGAIKSRKNFADRPLLDRIIGYGIAIHEGQLFGWVNQALGLLTALGLVLLSVSSIVLWWRRRDSGVLGAPPAGRARAAHAYALLGIIVLLGVLLPFLGITLIAVLLLDQWVLRYIPAASHFLGLNQVTAG